MPRVGGCGGPPRGPPPLSPPSRTAQSERLKCEAMLGQALGRLQGSQEEEVVVVTGVGGTDDRTSSHKHASHTKGGTVDAAVVESLTKGDAGALLSTRAPSPFAGCSRA